jgi:hypothetical protein
VRRDLPAELDVAGDERRGRVLRPVEALLVDRRLECRRLRGDGILRSLRSGILR